MSLGTEASTADTDTEGVERVGRVVAFGAAEGVGTVVLVEAVAVPETAEVSDEGRRQPRTV